MKRDERQRLRRVVQVQAAGFAMALTPALALADPDLLVPLTAAVSLPGLAVSTAANVALFRMRREPDMEQDE